jgi:hypothetical protein
MAKESVTRKPTPARQLRAINRSNDPLAFRAFMLSHHGVESLQNCIYADHGREDSPRYSGLRSAA